MSTPSSSLPSQTQKRATPAGGPTTPAATTSMAATPRSQPTPSTSHPTHTSSPSATRTGASPAAQRVSGGGGSGAVLGSGLSGKHLAGKSPAFGVAGKTVAGKTVTGSPAPGGLSTPTPQGAASSSSMQHTMSSVGLEMGSFDSPAGLGGLGLGVLDGGVSMGISMSSLGAGMPSSVVGKADDEEKRRRLESVLAAIGSRSGRISVEGLERLSRRYGMDIMWDEGMGNGKRMLSMAGHAMVIDVEFKKERSPTVDRVALSFHGLNDSVTERADAAAKILRQDLTPSTKTARVNATLEQFERNLERLSRLDRLSVPGANCFEAISGVYTSLKRLYDHERKAAEEIFGLDESADNTAKATNSVMCKHSGKPNMHARRTVGFSLDYWKDHHLVPPGRTEEEPAKDLDGDVEMHSDDAAYEPDSAHDEMYSMIIEMEHVPTGMYPTIRVADQWLSDRIEKPINEDEDPLSATTIGPAREIEWLDPPAPLLPSVQTNPTVDTNSNSGRPQCRFVAKFDPSVILPLQIASEIAGSMGVNLGLDTINPAPLVNLILPHLAISVPAYNMGGQATTTRKLHKFSPDESEDTEQEADIGLFLSRSDAGFRLTQLPFVHPRELIALLPVLRQYAYLTRLLRNTFQGDTIPTPKSREEATTNDRFSSVVKPKKRDYDLELDAMLATSPTQTRPKLDVSFAVFPQPPHVEVTIPSSRGVKRAMFAVLPNADVEVTQQDIVAMDDESFQKKQGELAQGLMVCEDLAVWAEWVKKRFIA